LNKRVGLLIGVAFAAVFAAILTYSMMSLRKYRVEVCITFNGRTECRVAAGATQDEALRTATDNACTLLASGMTDTMACGRTEPKSVRWLD
jgi:hypothetical protein